MRGHCYFSQNGIRANIGTMHFWLFSHFSNAMRVHLTANWSIILIVFQPSGDTVTFFCLHPLKRMNCEDGLLTFRLDRARTSLQWFAAAANVTSWQCGGFGSVIWMSEVAETSKENKDEKLFLKSESMLYEYGHLRRFLLDNNNNLIFHRTLQCFIPNILYWEKYFKYF